jgi:serine/threonine-protein kinase
MSTDSDHRKIGPFQLEGRLGVGGMGIVYKATYLKGGQKVALKVLSPDLTADPKLAKRFDREMEILKKLKHPNIVKYYGGSSNSQQRFYAMELVTGGSLEDRLRQQGKLPWEEAVDYAIQVARALEHAHDAGIVHRDLKPANLLLAGDKTLKLSDFGIARDTRSTALTAAGKTLGTMAYMAPEQITGKSPVTRRTDIYALGCVLFQMLTGRTPFESSTQPELLFKHIEEEPPNVREFNMDCPIWLDRLVHEMLAKDPGDRPFDALAVQTRLADVRQKVYEQESIAKATMAGGGGAATLKELHPGLARALGKQPRKKKKRDPDAHLPVYERTWFLALSLFALIGLAAWWAWPESEAAMYARLKGLMASDDSTQQTGSEEDVRSFLERFPESSHATEAHAWLEEIDLIRARRRLSNLELRANAEPDNEGQRLFLQARRYEKDGDRLGALERYEAMTVLLADKPDLKPYRTLAAERIRAIHSGLDSEADPVQFVRREIAAADALYQEGKSIKARERWKAIVAFYRGKPEFLTLIEYTTARLEAEDAATAIREFPIEME